MQIKCITGVNIITIALLLYGCATTSDEDTHMYCERTQEVAQYEQYCCQGYSNTGHCRGTCTRPSGTTVTQCVEWSCDTGYVKQEIEKENLKWWQFAGAFECVPGN